MVKTLFTLLCLSAAIWSIDAINHGLTSRNCNRRTKPNEVYSDCGNNVCQNTCQRPSASVGCVGGCVPGCVCSPGFLRNTRNICVVPSACDSPITNLLCGVNEVFSNCGNDGCRPTCTRPVTTGCVSTCSIPSCVCVAGYVRNTLGQCVFPSQCPATQTCSGINEVFSNCGNDGCQRSCTRLDVSTCIPVCSTPGCICDVGFVRNAFGTCVLPTTCPTLPCTGANEIFSTCGDDGCLLACNRPVVSGCTAVCSNPRCICAPGYVRNSVGVCVLPSLCGTPVCTGANEIYSLSENHNCQKHCGNPIQLACVPSPASVPGCICNTNYFRNYQGKCVMQSECGICMGGASETFSNCGVGACERTCATPDLTGVTCSTSGECVSRCFCSAGLVRNSAGNCVFPRACP